MGGGFILAGLTLSVFIAITGRYLSQHKHHLFCMVMAAIECLSMPFGTILGIFTIIVLMHNSVKELFSANQLLQSTVKGNDRTLSLFICLMMNSAWFKSRSRTMYF